MRKGEKKMGRGGMRKSDVNEDIMFPADLKS